MSEIVTSEVLADPHIHRLVDLRLGLLRLHKTLLEMERINFEKRFGRVNSWEVVTKPAAVASQALRLGESAQAIAIGGFFTLLVLVVYVAMAPVRSST